ncbi:helix-turn-helix domain-containing protein [Bifidobacterium miconisargentati]|uniref:helix-turn-helix domain-containing protein n=1 Tax=Bifidobacterium miconisargentati TaxID=2834437 RepID=UPI003B832DE4
MNTTSATQYDVKRIEEVIRYNIRRYLRLLGRSQNSLAPSLGCTRGAISQMMTGLTSMKFSQVYMIARELGVSIDDLMDDTYIRQDEEFLEKMNTTSIKKASDSSEAPTVPPVGLEPTLRRF